MSDKITLTININYLTREDIVMKKLFLVAGVMMFLLLAVSAKGEYNVSVDLGGSSDVFNDVVSNGMNYWVTGYTNAGGDYRMVLRYYDRYSCMITGATYGSAGHDFKGYAIAKDSSGNIYVAGEEDGYGYVWKFNSAGALTTQKAYATSSPFKAIAVGDAGYIYFGGGSYIYKTYPDYSAKWGITTYTTGDVWDLIYSDTQLSVWSHDTGSGLAVADWLDLNTGASIGANSGYSLIAGEPIYHGLARGSSYHYWIQENNSLSSLSEFTAGGYLPACALPSKEFNWGDIAQFGGVAVASDTSIHVATYSNVNNYTRYVKYTSPCTLADGWTSQYVGYAIDVLSDNSAIIVGTSPYNLDGGTNAGIWYSGGYQSCGESGQTSGSITRIETPIYSSVDNTETVRVWVKNIGGTSSDFVLGYTVGDNLNIYSRTFSGLSCNRDCYADGKGDYVHTGVIAPNDEVMVERTFQYKNSHFTAGVWYDIAIGLYTSEYLPPMNATDWVGYTDVIYLRPPFAYAYYAQADSSEVSVGDSIGITSYIHNNGTMSYNFTLGMSIGMWNAQDKQIYYTQQTPLIPPCNLECYKDDMGDWVYRTIPPNYTSYFTRTFKIPDYVLRGEPVDVAVAVWMQNGTQQNLISIVYFKNITNVSTSDSVSQSMGVAMKQSIDGSLLVLGAGFGINLTQTKLMLWMLITMVIVVIPTIKKWEFGMMTWFGMVIVGFFIGWIPTVLFIIMIVLSAGIVAMFMKQIFG